MKVDRKKIFVVLSLVLAYASVDISWGLLDYFGWINKTGYFYHVALDECFICQDGKFGYRISKSETEVGYATSDGEKLFSHKIRGNNFGFPDTKDFQAQKQKKYRLLVFGDSFSSGMYTSKPWPTLLDSDLQDIEIVNFSGWAQGISMWLNIQNEIMDKYEFDYDGVLVASCCDDYMRDIQLMDDQEQIKDSSLSDVVYIHHTENWYHFVKWHVIDRSDRIRPETRAFFPGLSKYIYNYIRFKFKHEKRVTDYKNYFPKEKVEKFFNYFKERNKKIILASVGMEAFHYDKVIDLVKPDLILQNIITGDEFPAIPYDPHFSLQTHKKAAEVFAKKLREKQSFLFEK